LLDYSKEVLNNNKSQQKNLKKEWKKLKHILIGTVETLTVSFEVMPYLFIKEEKKSLKIPLQCYEVQVFISVKLCHLRYKVQPLGCCSGGLFPQGS